MRRRDFIALIGSAAGWPASARAQERLRRVGVLMGPAANDPANQARITAFVQGLQELGWTAGRNVQIEYRWAAGKDADARKYAAELVALAPDVILVSGGSAMAAMNQATRTTPVVFTLTPDPVGAGYVESMARPGGNATGFTQYEYGFGAKWLELLKEIAPRVTRAAVLRDATVQGVGQFAIIQAAAPSLGIELRPLEMRDGSEIERVLTTFARGPTDGLIVAGSGLAIVHRDQIIAQAARHRLPAIYFQRFFAAGGGLMSYGPDDIDPHRRAAGYVDRILKGEKAADLPVQAPSKYAMVINLRTAKALGLKVPTTMLTAADEVIE
jgi:putative ABC transport system substrate-binding protein